MGLRDWRWRHIGGLWLGVALVATGVAVWHTYARAPYTFFWLIPYDVGFIVRGLLELTRRDPVSWVGLFWLPVAALITTAVWLVWRRDVGTEVPVDRRREGA